MSSKLVLPVVDLALKEANIVSALRKAATGSGFLYLTGHGVGESLQQATVENLKRFFSKPDAEKMKLHKSNTGLQRGYIGFFEQGAYGVDETDARGNQDAGGPEPMDFKEVFHIGTELSKEHPFYNDLLYPQNVWPDGDTEFKQVLSEYYSEMLKLSNLMFELFAVSLELPRAHFLEQSISTPMNSMNCVHYPPIESFPKSSRELLENQLGIGAHTDFEAFTLLNQFGPTEPCLDIYQNGRWMPVAPLPGALVVNIGDILARWSGDLFRSTVHRARNPTNMDRISIAFFRAPDFDALISSDLVPNRVTAYPPVHAGDHMLKRVAKANEPIL